MTPTEFQEWWNYHATHKPSHAEWLEQKGAGVDGGETLVAWQHSLRDVSLYDAKQCTDAIVSGVQPCYGADDVVRAIIGWSKHTRDSNYNRNPASTARPEMFDCYHCRDLGVRTVFHPDAMRALQKWPLDVPVEKSRNTKLSLICNVACQCKSGDRWENPGEPPKGKKRPSALPRFDRAKMVPVAGSSPTEDDIDALIEHIEKVAQSQLNRFDEFDEFNQAPTSKLEQEELF